MSTSTVTPTQTPAPTITPTVTPLVVQGTVMIWHGWEEHQIPALLKRIAAFQRVFPDIQFDVQYIPKLDLRAAFEAASIENRPPTILIGPAQWGAALYEQGWIADLSTLIRPEHLNTLNPAAVQTGRYLDAQISLPLSIEGVVLFRNAGILPRAPATFEELVTMAQTATQGETVGAVLERSFFFSGAHLYGLGGRLLNPDGAPDFNDDVGLEWVSLLQDFERAGPTDFSTDGDIDLFMQGRTGMIIESTSQRSKLSDAIGADNLRIDPWPIYRTGSLSGFIQAESIYLSPRALSEEHMVSWRFVEFFLSPESQSEMDEAEFIPAFSGSPAVRGAGQMSVSNPIIAQAMVALVDGTAYPNNRFFEIYPAVMDLALRRIFEDQVAPVEALQTAYDSILEAISVSSSVTPTPSP